MSVPSPWIALLLVAAAYRIWRLLAEDTILDKYRRKIVRLPLDWTEEDDGPVAGSAFRDPPELPEEYRDELAAFIGCPWCLGFWIAVLLWGFWQIDSHVVEVIATPFALSAGVGITRARLDPPD